MNVGHGVAPIPVPDGSPLGGYVDRAGPSSGVADRLEAHVVTVTDGSRRFALVVLDVVCVNVDLAAAVAGALADVDDVWVCATHTHSGPETGCHPRGAATPAPWLSVCAAAAREAARDAVAREVPGVLSAGVSTVAGVASVRSRPDGARPVPVDVVSFHTSGGLGGLLVVLPVHPTVLPAASTVVSADLTGSVRRALADRAPWVVVAAGAAGDISTRGVRQGADPAECDRLGAVVASQLTVPAPAGASGAVWSAAVELTVAPGFCRCCGLELKTGVPGPELSVQADSLEPNPCPQPPVESPQAEPTSDQGHCRCSRLELDQGSLDRFCRCKPITSNRSPAQTRRAETLRQAERLAVRSTEPLSATVRAARLGGVDLIGLPGEPFLDLRARTGNALLLGYVGGYLGYLPTREAFAGEPTYETVISPVAAGEPERLVDAAVGLFQNGLS
jgi:hypothetical protein